MLKRTMIVSLIFSLCSLSLTGEASSTLILNKSKTNTVAVNLDWKYREGAVIVHPRDSLMVSSIDNHVHHPLIWKSRYASVVFHAGNRFKPGLSANGMNEKGLVASAMLLKSTGYPPLNQELPTLNTSEWVQYVLDNYQTVQELVDDSANYQLLPSTYRGVTLSYHLVVNDAEGNSAVIEYLNGRLVVHSKDQLSHMAITNTEYDSAVMLLNDYKDFGGSKMLPGSNDSNSRFVRAAHYLNRLPSFIAKEEHIAYAFNGLSTVAQGPGTKTPTQLSIVFDAHDKTIYFRSINESAIRVIALADFNFDGLYQPRGLNPYQHLSGDVVKEFRSQYY